MPVSTVSCDVAKNQPVYISAFVSLSLSQDNLLTLRKVGLNLSIFKKKVTVGSQPCLLVS